MSGLAGRREFAQMERAPPWQSGHGVHRRYERFFKEFLCFCFVSFDFKLGNLLLLLVLFDFEFDIFPITEISVNSAIYRTPGAGSEHPEPFNIIPRTARLNSPYSICF